MAQDHFNLNDAKIISYSDYTKLPNFIEFSSDHTLPLDQFNEWVKTAFNLDASVNFKLYRREVDKLGFVHLRFKQYINEYPVDGTMLIVHIKDGNIISVNGDFYQQINSNFSIVLSEQKALQKALQKVNAKKYKWENEIETAQMRVALNDSTFSYLPKGELVAVHKSGTDYSAASIRLAYKFNIYAEEPLSRAYIYVDVKTGEIVSQEQILHTADAVGTATSLYSGTVSITSDNFGTNQYRLQETGRGNGIKTFNLENSSGYFPSIDFTNNSSTWNLPAIDQTAIDAHWAAEQTYDYFSQIHGRNSIDGNGYNLLNFVHYDVNISNAFWDGARMTYGDGNSGNGYTAMTALDICAHEITHGLVSFTAMLSGGSYGEPDALNEAWADILGTSIERFSKPTQWDWIMGEDVVSGGLRTMSDPHLSATPQPDTYGGQYWSSIGEPHTNDGPADYWYYLLCEGGNGTNDLGNSYNITGITIAKAQMIAFRAITAYATPSTNYSNMRACTIQAAIDLFGACSAEVIQTTNAWYAVGVGSLFSFGVSSTFTANTTTSCSVPYTINFSNTSTNASDALWNFGDNTTSTQMNPSHTYTSAGTYTVNLVSSGGCGTSSTTKVSYITITPPAAPITTSANSCHPAALILSATGGATLNWYTSATGGTPIQTGTSYSTPFLNTSTTYYVATEIAGPSGTVGPANNSMGAGMYGNSSFVRSQTFNVLKPCILVSVLVYASGNGNRTINLWDKTNKLIQTWDIYIPNGTSTVTLNAYLTPGTSYRLGGKNLNLFQNNSGAVYPYSYSGYVNITGTNFSSNSYYFFYNWVIQAAPCTSARTPVIAAIGPPKPVTYSAAAYDTLCLSSHAVVLAGGAPSGGIYSGIGVSNGVFNPVVYGIGAFVITYTYSDLNGCIGTATQTIQVNNCTGIDPINAQGEILIYPNPSSGNFTIDIGLNQNDHTLLKVVNTIGQTVALQEYELLQGTNQLIIHLNHLEKGIYYVQIKTSTDTAIKRIIIN